MLHTARPSWDVITLRILLLTFMAVVPSLAHAQEGDPAEMERLSKQANDLYAGGNFTDAARTYLKAYEARNHPNLLKNAAISWFKAGRCTEAVRWSTTYAEKAEDAEKLDERDLSDLEVIRAKCAILDARSALAAGDFDLAEEALESVPDDIDHAETKKLQDEVRAEIAAARIGRDPDEPIETVAQDESADSPADTGEAGLGDQPRVRADADVPADVGASGWPYVGWTAIGVGAAALATQAVIRWGIVADDVRTARDFEERFDCEMQDGETVCNGDRDGNSPTERDLADWEEAKEDIDRYDGAPEILMVAGGSVLIGIGAAIVITDYLSGVDSFAVAPSVGRDGAGATLAIRF